MSGEERREPVPAGYKMTEVGVIPEDWEIRALGHFAFMKSGHGITSNRIAASGDFPVYGGNGIRGFSSRATHEGDFVLIGRQGALCGNVTRVSGTFYASEHAVVCEPAPEISPDWLFFVLARSQLNRLSESSAQPGLSVAKLRMLRHAVPPLPEQRAIAEALSDVDNLLDALNRLIVKKRAVKQAVMQQLLTGKTRLRGFAGEWEETTLGEIGTIVGGGTPSTSIPEFWNGSVSWVTPTDITACESRFLTASERQISEKGLNASSAQLLPVGSILLCTRATIGEARIASVPVSTNQGFQSIIIGENLSNQFVYYQILTLKSQMLARAIGSTFLEIGRQALASIEIALPPLPEQRAIRRG